MARALIVVDVQNDFCEGGALAVEGGNATAANISQYLKEHGSEYDLVVATRDWHDADSDNEGHFSTTPDFIDSWPPHCVANTHGAAFHPDVWPEGDMYPQVEVRKGQGMPAYSGFEGITGDGESLLQVLQAADIIEVDVAGLAFDYCVKATAIDAGDADFTVRVLRDFTAAIHHDDAADEALAFGGIEVVG